MNSRLHNIPALAPALGVCAGIVLWSVGIGGWVALVAAIVGTALIIKRLHLPGIAILCLAAGWGIATLNAPTPLNSPQISHLQGKVTAVKQSSSSVRLLVDAPQGFRAEIYLLPGGEMPLIGDSVSIAADLRPARAYADLPGEPDMSLYYLQRGISVVGYAQLSQIEVFGHSDDLASRMAQRREHILANLADSGIDDETFAILAAMIVGYDDELPDSLREQFRASGIAHALALSGFHVGIIMLIVTILLYPLRFFTRLRTLRLLLSILFIWLYVAFTGFPLSVTRAAIMASIYLLSLAIGRRSNPLNSLCVALLIICAIQPFSIFSPGLQLSVAAVCGIIAFTRPLTIASPRRRLAYHINTALAVPIAAIIGTLPLTIAYFHRLPLLFLAPNIIVALLMPLWMLGGVALIVADAIGIPCGLLASALDGITDLAEVGSAFIATLPGAELTGVYLAPAVIIALIIFCISAAICINIGTRRAMYATMAMAGAFLATACLAPDGALPEQHVRISRQPSTTAIVIGDGKRAFVIHTSTNAGHAGVVERLSRQLEGYTAICGIDSLIFVRGDFSCATASLRGDILSTPTRSIAIPHTVSRRDTTARQHVDYLLVGNCFRGSFDHLLDLYPCDTVLIGSELSAKRTAACLQSCHHLSIPALQLSDR